LLFAVILGKIPPLMLAARISCTAGRGTAHGLHRDLVMPHLHQLIFSSFAFLACYLFLFCFDFPRGGGWTAGIK